MGQYNSISHSHIKQRLPFSSDLVSSGIMQNFNLSLNLYCWHDQSSHLIRINVHPFGVLTMSNISLKLEFFGKADFINKSMPTKLLRNNDRETWKVFTTLLRRSRFSNKNKTRILIYCAQLSDGTGTATVFRFIDKTSFLSRSSGCAYVVSFNAPDGSFARSPIRA